MEETLSELIKDNPWTSLSESIYNPSYKLCEINDESNWLTPETEKYKDKSEAIEYKRKCRKGSLTEKHLLFNLDPAPWVGRWNCPSDDDRPRLVILTLNPGLDRKDIKFGDECNFTKLTNEENNLYNNLMHKWLRGEATTTEIIFSSIWRNRNNPTPKENEDNNKPENYWINLLYPLFKEVTQSPLSKEELMTLDYDTLKDTKDYDYLKVKSFFDNIIIIEFCPYHSKPGGAVRRYIFPSSKFNARIVNWLYGKGKDKGTTVLMCRSEGLWKKILDPSIQYIKLKNNQRTFITEGNCDEWCVVTKAFDKVNM